MDAIALRLDVYGYCVVCSKFLGERLMSAGYSGRVVLIGHAGKVLELLEDHPSPPSIGATTRDKNQQDIPDVIRKLEIPLN